MDDIFRAIHFGVGVGMCVPQQHSYIYTHTHDRFKGLGSILGYLEVMGVMVFSFFERWWVGETTRQVQATSYVRS